MTKEPDYAAVRRHAENKRVQLFEHLDRNRSVYADVNREFYPLGVAGWTHEVEDIADSCLYDEEHRMLTAMPMICLNKGSSGFNANLTPPSSPWFRLKNAASAADRATHAAKSALDRLTEAAREIMSRSNTYKALAKLYDHILVNGFGCMLVFRDTKHPRNIISITTLRPGTYALEPDEDGMICRCVRRFSFTAEQIINEFGEAGVPERIRREYNRSKKRYTIYNLIEPHAVNRNDRMADKTGISKTLPYRSVYWLKEANSNDPQSGILELSGNSVKPIIAPRFDYENGDTYGVSPCIKALSLARGAQTFRYDTLNISMLRAEQPLVLSAEFKDEGFDSGRGGKNYCRFGDQSRQVAYPLYGAGTLPDANDTRLSLAEVVDEMKTLLFVTAFQTIDSLKTNRGVKTATEVNALVRENMEGLGPVVMNLDRELLDPLVSAIVQYLLEAGVVPFSPGEENALDDAEIEYISQIHVAARQSTISVLRDNAQMILNLSQAYPQARHRLDVDKTIDQYAELTGCPAAIFADEQTVAAGREADAQATQQQQQLAAMESLSKSAAAAGGMPTDEQHAGSRIADALSGTLQT